MQAQLTRCPCRRSKKAEQLISGFTATSPTSVGSLMAALTSFKPRLNINLNFKFTKVVSRQPPLHKRQPYDGCFNFI